MNATAKATRARSAGAAALVGAALLAAGCGSSSAPGQTSSAAGGGYGTSVASAASAKAVSIKTARQAGKSYLTAAGGRAVYLWTADSRNTSKCSGACASTWQPVVTKGHPAASGGARAAMLGTISRGNGARQVTYDGHPLYYFAGDTAAGMTSGEGSDGFGAKWWLVAPAGTAITVGAGGAAAPASSSSSSGGGW